jgi:hypothetical protein
MWQDTTYLKLATMCGLRNAHIDQCMLGAVCPDLNKPYQKPTKIHHNFPVAMTLLEGHRCRHSQFDHTPLKGYAECTLPKTFLASRYPPEMCDLILQIIIELTKIYRPEDIKQMNISPPFAHQAYLQSKWEEAEMKRQAKNIGKERNKHMSQAQMNRTHVAQQAKMDIQNGTKWACQCAIHKTPPQMVHNITKGKTIPRPLGFTHNQSQKSIAYARDHVAWTNFTANSTRAYRNPAITKKK